MNDSQFEKFVQILDQKMATLEDSVADKVTERVSAAFEQRFQDIEGKIDWLMGTMNEFRNEHLALCFTSENHEKRIAKLELAARN